MLKELKEYYKVMGASQRIRLKEIKKDLLELEKEGRGVIRVKETKTEKLEIRKLEGEEDWKKLKVYNTSTIKLSRVLKYIESILAEKEGEDE